MTGILVIALALLTTGASAQEDPKLFTILESSPDFRPLQGYDLVAAPNDQLLFMLGSTPDADGDIDAALVALDPRSGDEEWRVVRGEPGQRDVFTAVATARSFVCTSGVGSRTGADVLLVGCYSVRSGDPIWEKEVASPTSHSPAHVLRAEGRNLLMWIPSPINPSLLRFDLLDGNP